MKRKIVAIPLLAATLIFIIAYTTIDKGSATNNLVSANEKKEVPVAKKTKPQKKKIRPVKVKQTEKESSDSKEEIPEPQIAISPQDVAIRNVILNKAMDYSARNKLSTDFCFLIDMSLPSGRNRFFVYDLKTNSVICSGLVAHGSCNQTFSARPKFSNETSSGCSSLGKYQVGQFYKGKYGKSYRLLGLDNSNSNAYNRAVVIHGYDCVPDKEIYPRVLCNSFGCPMVSYKFFNKLSSIIHQSDKPILLWIYQ